MINFKKEGFTLIELLVVIAIVGILAGFIAIQMNGAINVANDAKKKVDIDTIKKALIMDRIISGTYPIENVGCVIGVDCENLDPVILQNFLDDLNEGFIYKSDGDTFTISSTLSSGYAYQFDSTDNSYSSNIPVNATCGASNGANLSSIPTVNLCETGTPTAVTGSGPWSWSCEGSYGGTSPTCTTGGLPVNGSCGLAAQSYVYSASDYAGAYCATGTASSSPSFPAQGSSVDWICNGANTGTNSGTCTASRDTGLISGSCGSANKTYLALNTSYGADSFCGTGTVSPASPSFPAEGGSTSWTCAGINGGTTASCSASRGNFTYVYFKTVGTSSWTVPAGVTLVDVYVLGGGGGGGDYYCGGGGGYTTNAFSYAVIPGQSISVTVGAGGPNGQGAYGYFGGDGGSSSFASVSAAGGLGCSQTTTLYGRGGSGGGGTNGSGGTDGGNGTGSSNVGIGQGTSTRPFLSMSFDPLGAGGGGKGAPALGGFYGGGNGCAGDYCSGASGLPNTGGGGGSMWGAGQHTGAGGSGMVIVRY